MTTSDTATSTWAYRDGAQTVQVPVRGRIVANNGAALMEAASRGMGMARQPDFIVKGRICWRILDRTDREWITDG